MSQEFLIQNSWLIALAFGTAAWKLLDKKMPSWLVTKYESSPRRQAFGNALVLLATAFALVGLLTDEWRLSLPMPGLHRRAGRASVSCDS